MWGLNHNYQVNDIIYQHSSNCPNQSIIFTYIVMYLITSRKYLCTVVTYFTLIDRPPKGACKSTGVELFRALLGEASDRPPKAGGKILPG